MKKMILTISGRAALILTLAMLVMSLVGCVDGLDDWFIKDVPTDEEYTFTNPEPVLAEPDAGFKQQRRGQQRKHCGYKPFRSAGNVLCVRCNRELPDLC